MLLTARADLVELGTTVAAQRKALGWTQAELAMKAAVAQGALSQFEQAGRGIKLDRLIAVLRVLGLGLELVQLDMIETAHDESALVVADLARSTEDCV